jgi:hypothetical protein
MKNIITMLAFGVMLGPAMALSCNDLVLKEAVAFTLKYPKEKWYGNSAQTIRFNNAEHSAKAWIIEHAKGKDVLQRAKEQRRANCTL